MALGSLIIQTEYNYFDLELVAQIQENPYYQFFIGLPGYQDIKPYDASLLVHFRKRLTPEVLGEINKMIVHQNDDNHKPGSGSDGSGTADDEPKNEGTIILDATCAPSQITFPQDTNLLNECRVKLEALIDYVCEENNIVKPRTYREIAYKDYLDIARTKKRTAKKDSQSDSKATSVHYT